MSALFVTETVAPVSVMNRLCLAVLCHLFGISRNSKAAGSADVDLLTSSGFATLSLNTTLLVLGK